MAANVNGEKAYELLRENPTVRQELDNSMMPLDFEAIFKAVKGDVAVAMPGNVDEAGLHPVCRRDEQ